MVIVIASNR